MHPASHLSCDNGPPGRFSISGGQYGIDRRIRQTLLRSNRGNCELTKSIQPIVRPHPNAAFPILKDSIDAVARQPVGMGKAVGPILAHMQQTALHGPDPETAVAIAPEPEELLADAAKRVLFGSTIDELSHPAQCR